MGLMMASLGVPPAPSSTGSPLGRFADLITAVVSLGVITAALLSHLGIVGTPDTFIDAVALVAVGVIYGTARGISAGRDTVSGELAERANLNTQLAIAAHDRLDRFGAPASPLNHSGYAVGKPAAHGTPGTAITVADPDADDPERIDPSMPPPLTPNKPKT